MKNRLILPMFLAVTECLVLGAQDAAAPKPSFSLTISTPQAAARAGSPMPLKIALKNISDHDLAGGATTVRNESQRAVDIKVYDADGKPVPETAHGKLIHGRLHNGPPNDVVAFSSGGTSFKQHPGQSLSEDSDLSKEFDLTKPGRYTVQAERFDWESNLLVKSNTIAFTIE